MDVVTFTELRNHLKEIMDATSDRHEAVVIKRSRNENMVMLSQSDYESLRETAYLLSNAANAEHLRRSLRRLQDSNYTTKKLIDE